jgi:2-C-methyl-D-erythritol 4-phosphate cytidylyltransferase
MKKYAVIVAGGSGQRMGTQVPKQFLLLQSKPVLWHTLNVFLGAYEDLDIILVLPEEHMETGKKILYATIAPERIRIVAGGATRFHSVQNGLRTIREESVIFVHDGVRCLLTTSLIHHCYEQALEHGSAIPVIDCRDSVRLITPEGNEAIDRSRVKLVQTPQTFVSSVLVPAFTAEFREEFTDEATVVEAAGNPIHLVDGEINNIKITMPADLAIAEELLGKG